MVLDRDGKIEEYDLITIIDDVLEKFPYVRVWNLSLGRSTPCEAKRFSPLATALDERMKKHDVLFVIAAGNYTAQPYRAWPPDDSIFADGDRICAPADALRGVTVGGIAHLDNPNRHARRGEPSPFFRRGPASAFIPKPDISFPAGNCDHRG